MKKKLIPDEVWVLPARRPHAPETQPERSFEDKAPQTHESDPPAVGRGRVVLQAGFGLCVSFVLAACGASNNQPKHVGPPLGDTHVSQAPSDPTVPPPDAGVYEEPSPGYEITPPVGPSPNLPAPSSQEPAPQPEPQPGVFSPPPPPTGPADVPQPEIPKP